MADDSGNCCCTCGPSNNFGCPFVVWGLRQQFMWSLASLLCSGGQWDHYVLHWKINFYLNITNNNYFYLYHLFHCIYSVPVVVGSIVCPESTWSGCLKLQTTCLIFFWNLGFIFNLSWYCWQNVDEILQRFGFVTDFSKIVCRFMTFDNLSCLSCVLTLLLLHWHVTIRYC